MVPRGSQVLAVRIVLSNGRRPLENQPLPTLLRSGVGARSGSVAVLGVCHEAVFAHMNRAGWFWIRNGETACPAFDYSHRWVWIWT
jgi:hypothetical protein